MSSRLARAGRAQCEINPLRACLLAGRDGPRVSRRLGDVGVFMRPRSIFPGKSDVRRVAILRAVDEVRFGAGVRLATVISKADLN